MRLETFRGAEHAVAPIVLLIGDSVIHPLNAPTPEFVPASVLAVAPRGWDGRPAMAGDHPQTDGVFLSANSPEVLERAAFGQLFGVTFEANKLAGEVWLDLSRAARVQDAREILERVRAGEPVEISVGAFVVTQARDGQTADGRSYGSVWEEVIPDHVALLRDGLTGACSVAMGCGTPRAAIRHLVSTAGLEVLQPEPTVAATKSCETCHGVGVSDDGETACNACHGSGRLGASAHPILFRDGDWCVMSASGDQAISRHKTRGSALEWKRQRRMLTAAEEATVSETQVTDHRTLKDKLLGLFSFKSAQSPAEMSDEERRELIGEAMKRIETQFVRVMSITGMDAGDVVYLIDPDPGGPSPLRPYKRTYAISTEGRATFGDDRVPVRPSTQWVPVLAKAAAGTAGAAASGCGCENGNNTGADAGAGGGAMAGANAHRNAERIKALVASDHAPWTAHDQAYLEGMTDERLAEVEANAAAGKTTAEARTVADTKLREKEEALQVAAASKSVKWDDIAPPEVKQIVARDQARTAARKTLLVSRLVGAQSVIKKEQLEARDLASLEELAAVAGIQESPADVDFGLHGARTFEGGGDAPAEPPRSYDLALAKRKNAAA